MAKINILSAQVFNRIAAGEVVDRPYSVVKELVENSIDAGATEIEIYVENGGKQLIRVVDNGSGIERDDLHSAFLPHATSKISKAEDLDSIMTLGFRGEAVASIAAVSKMTITSKVENGKGYSLSCSGGEMGAIAEVSCAKGTDACVEMLFFNAPVRLKFLKTDKAEETDITTFVSRFILNRPDICFTYFVNGKKVLQSFGGGDEEALVCVYGAGVRSQCIELNAEKHGLRIRGYIGNTNFTKPNKSYQCVFINGRYVLNGTVSSAVYGAYASYLMKRQYPFYVLHIDLSPELVDVNVSPNKTDVRFVDNNVVYGCIYSVISAVLDGKAGAMEYVVPDKNPTVVEELERKHAEITVPAEKPQTTPKMTLSESILSQVESEIKEEKKRSTSVFGFDTLTYEEAQKEIESVAPTFKKKAETAEPSKGFIPIEQIPDYEPDKIATVSEWDLPKRNPKRGNPERLLKIFPEAKYTPGLVLEFDDPTYTGTEPLTPTPQTDYFSANKQWLEELDRKQAQDKIDVSTCTYVGKIFNTYLMYEKGDDV
ncbi:MAG: DNA mismatch repair endonuclease MutL, partial [Clostridia bacterium]|nr:DNA mismatch repair endonuclease MutL [Clostridia bacterium]